MSCAGERGEKIDLNLGSKSMIEESLDKLASGKYTDEDKILIKKDILTYIKTLQEYKYMYEDLCK